nr:GNAT family N-acetyltransferase [Corynebacterium mendelii]
MEDLSSLACFTGPGHDFSIGFNPGDDPREFLRVLGEEATGLNLRPSRVRGELLIATRDGAAAGAVSIRYALNGYLRRYGGHIGYGVLPQFRRRGIATVLCRTAVQRLYQAGVPDALVTCDSTNTASRATITACGGKPLDRISDPVHRREILRFRIPTRPSATMPRVPQIILRPPHRRDKTELTEFIRHTGSGAGTGLPDPTNGEFTDYLTTVARHTVGMGRSGGQPEETLVAWAGARLCARLSCRPGPPGDKESRPGFITVTTTEDLRGHGHTRVILRETLLRMGHYGSARVAIDCAETNRPGRHTIEALGGVLQGRATGTGEAKNCRYIIDNTANLVVTD